MKKLPIGIQSFEKLRTDNFIYVDKTEYIYELTKENGYYFISRPRRFGKSLLVDTIKCLFEGKKELFEGLFIYDKWNWEEKYPVIKISFGSQQSKSSEDLERYIQLRLKDIAKLYEVEIESNLYYETFEELIKKLSKINRVVILIDEYDKPIIDKIEDVEVAKELRDVLKGFYQVMKDCDEWIRFVLLTGVSKFSKVSIFSGLNNLNDITIDDNFSGICGYKEEDLDKYFREYLNGVDRELLRFWYNGYSWGGDRVYNPFDILLFFSKRNDFRPYWFETGTPTFLIKLLMNDKFYIPELENVEVDELILSSFDIGQLNPVAVLFQTGYLTIEEIERGDEGVMYHLSYPNYEVRMALNRVIMRSYLNENTAQDVKRTNNIKKLMREGEMKGVMQEFSRLFSGIPYQWYVNNRLNEYEGFYSSIFYSVFNSLGLECVAEDITNRGRIDLTIKIDNYLYIFEFKVIEEIEDSKKPLEQIKERRYFEKYQQENKEIILVGIEFSKEKRNIKEYAFEKVK
jgi:hypothetical protein